MKRSEQRKLELNKNIVKVSNSGQRMNIDNDQSLSLLSSSDVGNYNKQNIDLLVKKILKIFSFIPKLGYSE